MDGFGFLRRNAGPLALYWESPHVSLNGIPFDHSFSVLVLAMSDPWLATNAGDVLMFTAAGSVNFYPSMFEWTLEE